jgi:putative spermidine/putrescine transport system permease protein
VDDDGLGALGQATDESQGPLVTDVQTPPFGKRGEREEYRPVDVVGGQQNGAGEPRVGDRHGDTDHEGAVDGEVGGDVEEGTSVGRHRRARDGAVQPVQAAVDQPQHQGDRPLAASRGDRRADPNHETGQRQGVGADTHGGQPATSPARGRFQRSARNGVEHQRASSSWTLPRASHAVVAALPVAVIVVVLFGGAVVTAAATTVRDPAGRWTLDVWREVLADPALMDAVWFSLRITLAVTVLSAALAVPIAAGVRNRLWTKAVSVVPLVIPHLTVAVLAVLWVGPGGLADRLLGGLPLQMIRDRAGIGIVAVYVIKEVPFLVLLVTAAWGEATREREEAAAVLGAGLVTRFRFVTWPAIRLPLVTGSLIVAAFVLGAFEVPLVVGPSYPPTLATLAFEQTRAPDLAGGARAAAVLLLATGLTLLLAGMAARVARRHDA